MASAVQTCRRSAESVPAPMITTSATARNRPITMRSCALNPLMSPPLAWPFVLSETTPSSEVTKLLKTWGRARDSGMRKLPYKRASRGGSGRTLPRLVSTSVTSGWSLAGPRPGMVSSTAWNRMFYEVGIRPPGSLRQYNSGSGWIRPPSGRPWSCCLRVPECLLPASHVLPMTVRSSSAHCHDITGRQEVHSTNTSKIMINKSIPPPIYIFDSGSCLRYPTSWITGSIIRAFVRPMVCAAAHTTANTDTESANQPTADCGVIS